MIPRLIHQTAKTRDLPPEVAPYQRTLVALHPGWTYKLWTDEDNLAFVKAEYPDFVGVFTALPRNIMRADVIRYLLMDRLGGMYMDTDYEMLRPFDMTEREIVLPWESDGEGEGPKDKICNSFFASRAGHPFWKMMIDDLRANPPLAPDADVESSTGPGFITRVFHKARKQGMELYAPARPLFNPPTPRNQRQHRAIVDAGVAYGIHHCAGTWRTYTLAQRVRSRVANAVHRFM